MAEVTSGMLDALQSAVIEDEAKKAQEKKKYKHIHVIPFLPCSRIKVRKCKFKSSCHA